MTTMAFLTRVLVLTHSLLAALYTTSMILVLREMPSEPQEKFPWSRRRARYFLLPGENIYTKPVRKIFLQRSSPPRTRRVWILCGASLVMAAGLANSNFLFFLMGTRLPPVARRLCQ